MIRNRQGFTLLELMIVVAIVAIAATMAFPSFDSYTQRAKLKKAGRNLYSDFQRTRINALRDNKAYGIQFDSNGYKVWDLGDDVNWAGGDDIVVKTVSLADYGPIKYGAGTGIDAVPDDTIGIGTGVNFTDNKARLTGSIDTDNATTQNFVYLMNTRTDETMAIQVSSTTGRLKLWVNWNGNWEDQ